MVFFFFFHSHHTKTIENSIKSKNEKVFKIGFSNKTPVIQFLNDYIEENLVTFYNFLNISTRYRTPCSLVKITIILYSACVFDKISKNIFRIRVLLSRTNNIQNT